jgi:hypothetical protein
MSELVPSNNGHAPELTEQQKDALDITATIPELAQPVREFWRNRLSGGGETIKPPRPRYVVRTAADALAPQPPIKYILKPLIIPGSVNVWHGHAGSGKTYCLISLGVCVARNLDWVGFKVSPCKVLIIDEESGERRLNWRLGEVLRGEECGPDTPISFVSLAAFKMDDGGDAAILQALIEAEGAGLVIIDALADITDGDENSKQDVQPVFNALRKIAEATNAAIVVIHHSGKNGEYRGSSAIKGAVDTMVLVESENGKNVINFTVEKNRDGEPLEWAGVATWIDDRFTLRPSGMKEKLEHFTKAEHYVLGYLEEHGASAIPVITAAADTCSPNSARFAVYSLADKRKIFRTNPDEGGKGVAAVYDLVKLQNEFPF